ncbi:MAG: hypothetical protein PVI31_12475 [Gemmatimonadota bacterium]|jgi:hypothetical protein
MPKTILGAMTLMLFLAGGASAQGHAHGGQAQSTDSAQAANSSQGMMQQRMQQMQERKESMQQMMQQRMQQGDMQGMQEGGMQGMQQGGMQSMQQGDMQGMGTQQQARARDQSCLASSAGSGLSALLLGSTTQLALTDEQTAELEQILARAQRDALDQLTAEQREQLEAAPSTASATCPRTTQTAPPAN